MRGSSWFILVSVIALLFAGAHINRVVAQEEMGGIAGEYTYEGQEGGEAYTGSQTVSGIGPVYVISFSETTESGATVESTVTTVAQGNVVAMPLPDSENCGAGTLLRQPNGALFSLWLDSSVGPTALGIEYWSPQAETTGFAGTYDLSGAYADGAYYGGTATITEGENGVYNVMYTFTADDKADTVPWDLSGVAMVQGDIMGYATGEACGVFVAGFTNEGTYEAVYVDGEGNIGTEAGSR